MTRNSTEGPPLSPEAREKTQDGYNHRGLVVLLLAMGTSLALFAYVSFFSGGVDLKEVSKVAAAATAAAPSASAPEKDVDISGNVEPWIENADVAAYGKKIYQTNCSMCHGVSGAGDGPAGGSLNPKPRNFIEGKWKKDGSSLGLFATLQSGIEGSSMQSYKHLPVRDRWALVQFIRSITKNKIADKADELKAKAPSLK